MSEPSVRYAYADTPLGQLHYAEAGAGAPVIMLHQTPRSLDEFADLQPLLATGRRVIAMDMYGFGMSAKPTPGSPQTIEQFACGVVALADALGLEQFAVLGHHTGMFVASEVAAAVPDRVTALVLSGAEYGDADFRESHAAGVDSVAGDVDVAPPHEDGTHLTTLWAKRYPFYPQGRPDILDRFIRDALAPGVDPAQGHAACARYVMEDRVELVTAPVLILLAPEDPVSYPHKDRIAKAYRNARSVDVVEIEGGMIPLMELHAPEVASAVTAFFERIGL